MPIPTAADRPGSARRLSFVLGGVLALSHPVAAQQQVPTRVASAPGAFLRGLDKVSGVVADMDISVGETLGIGRLQVTLGECRYPVNNPSGDAFAYLVIRDAGVDEPAFMGWMVASSPALNALEHPRYDVWVMRCKS